MDNRVILVAGVAAAVLLAVYLYRRDIKKFTRTGMSGCGSCTVTRSHVDYAFSGENPHILTDKSDKTLPLEDYPVDLEREEKKLWDQEKLWKEYDNNYPGLSDKPYIVNDDKTRFMLAETGNIGLHRYLNSLRTDSHYNGAEKALVDQDFVSPEPYKSLY